MADAAPVAVITGAGRGIGKAIAKTFAERGSPVVIGARNAARLEEAAAEMRAVGGNVTAVPTDVRDEDAVKRLMQTVLDTHGRIDVLVCGAATPVVKPTVDLTLDEWNLVLSTNLTGTFLCCREAGRAMLAQGSGRIITFGAINAVLAFPERLPHAASKAGVVHLTRALATEWTQYGINVNCVVPGWTRTEAVEEYIEMGVVDTEKIIARTPARRMATPEDIVGAVMFLAGPDSKFISGQSIVVDGGWTVYGFYE